MDCKDILDMGFLDARSKLLDIAAFMDRLDRAGQTDDFRIRTFRRCLERLMADGPGRTKSLLEMMSDQTKEPIEQAHTKGATGAWPEFPG